jgi:hypothetical protein
MVSMPELQLNIMGPETQKGQSRNRSLSTTAKAGLRVLHIYMRTILFQDHAQNLRDLLINYGLDAPEKRVIDFTYAWGSMWKTDYPYRLKLTKCDALPTAPDVVKKDLLKFANINIAELKVVYSCMSIP